MDRVGLEQAIDLTWPHHLRFDPQAADLVRKPSRGVVGGEEAAQVPALVAQRLGDGVPPVEHGDFPGLSRTALAAPAAIGGAFARSATARLGLSVAHRLFSTHALMPHITASLAAGCLIDTGEAGHHKSARGIPAAAGSRWTRVTRSRGCKGECPERQRGRTVNPLAYAFVGSSPTSPTIQRSDFWLRV